MDTMSKIYEEYSEYKHLCKQLGKKPIPIDSNTENFYKEYWEMIKLPYVKYDENLKMRVVDKENFPEYLL